MSWDKKDINNHTHSNLSTLDKLSDNGTILLFNGASIGGGSGGTSSSSNIILGGNVRFKVDFIAKTIAFTTWNLWSSSASFTLASGTKTFSTEMGTSTFYYVCYRSNTIELISNLSGYTGVVIFGIMNTVIYPFVYPLNQIGVNGGTIFNRNDISIGEWHQIGDSITFGGAFSYVSEEFYIPKITNTAVNGRRMSGGTGMWTDKDVVTTTTELITVMGGTNDQGNNVTRGTIQPVRSVFDTNTFIGAYQTLIEGLLTRIPTARIILFTPPRAWTDVSGTTLRSGLKDYGDDVKAIGAFYNLPVIDTYNNAGWNELNFATFLSDGLHPNDAGKRRLSALCSGAIKTIYQKI